MKKEELGELIIASEDMMYHVAKTLLYCDADCADAIQETIVKAFSKLHTLKSDVYAKTWLTRILINECYTVMRKEKKVVSLEDYQMGWLELGGYRIGIRSSGGIYYYYAHMESYAEDLQEGSEVFAGQFLGFVGDSGYGAEGTTGQFVVHLHLGIYVPDE